MLNRIEWFSDPHAVDQFIDKTPFDILTDADYKSDVNALFGCTFEVRKLLNYGLLHKRRVSATKQLETTTTLNGKKRI